MRRTLFLITCLILASSITGCARTQPLYNVQNAPVIAGTASGLTAEQVKDAILRAAREKGWIARESDGHILATIHVRSHMAEVDISYTATDYSITYENSSNLLYDGSMIHRNYNKWIKLLDAKIREELAYS